MVFYSLFLQRYGQQSLQPLILKAKEQGREHIGSIELIDEDLGTFVTQYDDDKERRIKTLKKKEELLSKKLNLTKEQKSK